ncbi:Transposase IS66 family protein [Enhydrobacter aerosaccus]|uniref:Transposase IS66 family protein n=1 Tax=Enhydrobacter aerosaccus TaxID=225324 RepID=A0A1T4JMM1_9HYPH|nr:transposase [Enhydrobacter aerosaccus]SJZ31422.1 Transposase IS66 family protein [Enhydrobacter aerosaccus]
MNAEKDVTAHPASLSRALLKAGLSVGKTLLASEAKREDVRQARDEWQTRRQLRMREEVHRRIFLDETATTTKMTRLRGRARHGARLKAKVPFGHWATQTFIAGLRCDGLTAPQLLALTAIGGAYFLVSLLRFRKVLATFQLHGSRRWSLSSPDLLRQADEQMRNTKSPRSPSARSPRAGSTRRRSSRPLRLWLEKQLSMICSGSTLAADIRYAFVHWEGLTRFLDDGHLELDTSPVENTNPGCGSDEEVSYASAIWGQSCWLAMLGDASRAKVAVFAIFYRAC